MGKTDIEWADKVWNPVTGCTKVSEGCRNCYAERIARRFWGERKFTDVRRHKERLSEPFHWKKPQYIFVNSMSDLFHPDVSDSWIDSIFAAMARAYWHTFLILTKRPERMRSYIKYIEAEMDNDFAYSNNHWQSDDTWRPIGTILDNIWFGVSAENQKTADERISILLRIPAAKRFVSVEPMLDKIDIRKYLMYSLGDDEQPIPSPMLDWVICGGETGPGARPMHPDWVRSLRDQCQAAGVPLWFKSWGCHIPTLSGSPIMRYTSKAKSHNLLDGRKWEERPE